MTSKEARICKAFLLAHNCEVGDYIYPIDERIDLSTRQIEIFFDAMVDDTSLLRKTASIPDTLPHYSECDCASCTSSRRGWSHTKEDQGECDLINIINSAGNRVPPPPVPLDELRRKPTGNDETRSESRAGRAVRQAMKRSSEVGATFSLPLDKEILVQEVATEIKLAVRDERKRSD
jgi:hypothetical protein